MTITVRAEINLSALRNNVRVVRQYAPNSKIVAMIKANAYGHGLVGVARALVGMVDAFGVARTSEALLLRKAGIQNPIWIFDGFFCSEELQQVLDYNLTPVLNSDYQLDLLERVKILQPLSVWIKLNTGMNRLGFSKKSFPAVMDRISKMAFISKPLGLMSHFASADKLGHIANQNQISLFDEMTKNEDAFLSLANSAAIIQIPESHLDWVRPGVMLFGSSPIPGRSAESLGLLPVMTLTSKIIAFQTIKKGGMIGYGGEYVCEKDSVIAIVAIGYGDGYPRHINPKTPVLIQGKQAFIVGRVSMDMIAVDVSDLSNVNIGDEVVLWGRGLSVDLIAEAAGTASYELLCQVSHAKGRVYFYERGDE